VDILGDGCVIADLTTAAGNRAMIDAALERHGRLDVLVLNAGRQFMSPLESFPEAEWDRLFDLMVKGPFLALQRAWPALTRRPGGRVIVTASGLSLLAEKYKAAYVAAKHAVLGLVKVAALEAAEHGLTVNAVAPAWMHTGMVEAQLEQQMRLRGESRDDVLARLIATHPQERFVAPEEVASLMLFLAGPQASGLNGACIPVDGGAFLA
jgi:3-hydroxybutyrate dehydrogenase